jgi:hypothetical protein
MPRKYDRDSGIGHSDLDETFRELSLLADIFEDNMAQAAAPAAPAAAPVNGSQLNAIKEFDGRTAEDAIVNWVEAMDAARASFTWADEVTAQIAKLRLTGTAAQWLKAEKMRGNLYELWMGDDGLRQGLLNRFKVTDTAVVACEAIISLKQGTTETIDEFFDRVVIAVDKMNFAVANKNDANYRRQASSNVGTFFSAGLKESIRSRLMGQGVAIPADIDDLRSMVRKIEKQMELERRQGKVFSIAELDNPDEKEEGELEGEINALSRRLEQLQKRRQQQGRGRRDFVCHYCKKKGHFARDCFQKKNDIRRGIHRRSVDDRASDNSANRRQQGRQMEELWTFEEMGNEEEEM